MKALFLDIDGVLVTTSSAAAHRAGASLPFSPAAVSNLRDIVRTLDLTVVLSSSWRLHEADVAVLAGAGIVPNDVLRTPAFSRGGMIVERGEEIDAFLAAHPEVDRYAIVDDLDDFRPHHAAHLVQTDAGGGLDDLAAQKIAVAIEQVPSPLCVAPLKLFPEPVLRVRCADADPAAVNLRNLANSMLSRLDRHGGIGMAAPQAGVLERLFVMSVPSGDRDVRATRRVCINPVVVAASSEKIPSREGCLSIPGVLVEVPRSPWIDLEFTEIDGFTQTVHLQGLEAICAQHEMDHLDGRLTIDHLGRHARGKALRTYRWPAVGIR